MSHSTETTDKSIESGALPPKNADEKSTPTRRDLFMGRIKDMIQYARDEHFPMIDIIVKAIRTKSINELYELFNKYLTKAYDAVGENGFKDYIKLEFERLKELAKQCFQLDDFEFRDEHINHICDDAIYIIQLFKRN
jgi:hypothetical protein